MFGKINLENFTGMTSMPQRAASAWVGSQIDELTGAKFKPLLYLGDQVVNGTNYYFIAEETLSTNPVVRRVVRLTIHELGGEFTLLGGSIMEII